MNLNIVPLKNNILVDFKRLEIKNAIVERMRNLNLDPFKYKADLEYLTLACNLIEHAVKKKDSIDKKELAIDVYNELLGGQITEDEINIIKANIEFIYKNKNIKKLSVYKLFKTGLSEWFKKSP